MRSAPCGDQSRCASITKLPPVYVHTGDNTRLDKDNAEGTGGGTPSVIFTRRDRSHAPVVNVELMESNDFSLIDNVVADLRAQSRQPRRK